MRTTIFETCATGILREGAITGEHKALPFVHNNAALFVWYTMQ